MKKFIIIGLFLAGVVLTACGSVYEKEPVGIGPEYSELKKAPKLPEWFS